MSCFLQKARYSQLLGWNHKGRRYRNLWKMAYNLWLLHLCTCSKVSSGELEITLSAGLVEWRAGRGAGGSEEKLEPSRT